MKVLYTTTIGLTMIFFKSFIKQLIDNGHVVDIATNEDDYQVDSCYRDWGCRIFHVSWSRSIFSTGNFSAVQEIRRIVNSGNYDIVHCHTPIAAACTRFACKGFRKNGLKVIYTAHGFHFYKGAPLVNWVLFFPLEKICSRWTDVLITINQEDYVLAQKKMKAGKIEYVPGVGIDINKFRNTFVDKNIKRDEIGVPKDAFLVLSVGELNPNKNHQIVLRSIAKMGDKNIHYAIAGKGNLEDDLNKLSIDLGIEHQYHFLGYRNDVAELYKAADIYALPSFREGLNVSVMEALASGLPCVVSKIRGNIDMVQDGENGYYIDPSNIDSFSTALIKASKLNNKISISCSADKYSFNSINDYMMCLYLEG